MITDIDNYLHDDYTISEIYNTYIVKNCLPLSEMIYSKHNYVLFFLMFAGFNVMAQNPYVLNGYATQNNCHCYTLTTAETFESGSIWNKNKIDLTSPFNFYFNVFLGCLDDGGADGIAFVLQPVSTSLGVAGQGIGFGGIVPSLGVTIDTYQNFNDNDPSYDHVAIQANGDVNHLSKNNLAGPVTALANRYNIEDCEWHVLHVNWQPAKQLLEVSIDDSLRLSLQQDIIQTVFNNDPQVYWGFTSATGGSVNLQQICTALNAQYFLAPHANTCIGTPLTFIDSSFSFGSITNWYWNFDDGTTYNAKEPPTHLYKSTGIYNVTLNIEGNDGCLSDTFKQVITIGSYPVADFNVNALTVCNNRPAAFTDATKLDVGTENYWYWNFGNGAVSFKQNPPAQLYSIGTYPVQFFIESKEGCASDTVEKLINVKQAPSIDITLTANEACKNSPIFFKAKNFNDTISIKQWYFNFDDGSFSGDSVALHAYLNGGNYNVRLVAQADNGCITDTITKPLTIYATNAYAGRDTTILYNYPYQLQASGGDSYTWSPSAGLNNPFIANPVATLTNDATYILTASTTLSCSTTDTLHLKVVKGPEIYAPTAFTPNGDGMNDLFKLITAGITKLNTFEIYNRWGEKIYSSQNAAEGWNGYYKGFIQPQGTYVWFAVATTTNGTIIKRKGSFVLIK